MRVVADLHLHSKYSRAVSQNMTLPIMAAWAEKKGIDWLATADWTHPLWLKEIESQLEESSEGVFKLKKPLLRGGGAPLFILSTEISSIYSQSGVTRRIHNLVFAPSFATVYKINQELKKKGCNLMSDGRPIVGLSSIQLAELVWSVDEKCLVIPAHIYTPWFSMFGSKSGFDSVEECWGEFEDRIYAIETGLSSDPEMNWQIEDLDNRSIISFSDAHSPAKLGRELTIFDLEKPDFNSLVKALKSIRAKDFKNKILYTLEFYPEEGKYHYSGHRNCAITYSSADVMKKGTSCPVCGRPLTLGVIYRVDQLSKGREVRSAKKENNAGVVGIYNLDKIARPPYIKLVPLMEILAEALSTGLTSQRLINEYERLIKVFGSELNLLTQTKTEEIKLTAGEKIAQAVEKVRKGEIFINPGYDGVFGVVKIWVDKNGKQEKQETKEQMALF